MSISIVILLIYFLNEIVPISYNTNIKGIIIDLEVYDSYSKYIVRTGINKVLVYDYDRLGFKVGDIVNIIGKLKDTDTYFVPGDFDYTLYLKHNHIVYSLSVDKIVKENHFYLIGEIRQFLLSYFDKKFDSESSAFMKALIVGYSKNLDEDFYSSLKGNGILHLFAISGLHVSLFIEIIRNILKKTKLNENTINRIIIIFLLAYTCITNFSASILRTSIMTVLAIIFKKKKIEISSLDICSLTFLILIIVNPYFMYNNGFILSFLVSFVLILSFSLTKDKGYIKSILITSMFSSIATLPIIINMNYEVNLLTPVLNVIFIFLMTSILLPLTLIFAFIPRLSFIYKYIIQGFIYLSTLASKIDIKLSLGKFSGLALMLFYVLLLVILSRKKKVKIIGLCLMLILLVVQSNLLIFNNKTQIYFLDLYYGESTVIFSPFKKSVVIIDTGDGTNNELTNFLKSKGVKRIDCLIITHNHEDHNGEVETLVQNFKVDKIVSNIYDPNIYGSDVKIGSGNLIKLSNFSLYCLNPSVYSEEENDNSLVLYTVIDGNKYLFMGDATKNIDSDIHIGKVDVVKIGHHGSSTSTSEAFIEELNPQYGIIMATRIKLYNFPYYGVIDLLEENNVEVYRTDKMKTILLESKNGKLSFYLPCKKG